MGRARSASRSVAPSKTRAPPVTVLAARASTVKTAKGTSKMTASRRRLAIQALRVRTLR